MDTKEWNVFKRKSDELNGGGNYCRLLINLIMRIMDEMSIGCRRKEYGMFVTLLQKLQIELI